MKYLILDTEGSGLFRYKDAAGNTIPSDAPGQPRLASLAMRSIDMETGEVGEIERFLIQRDGWSMEAEATAINGLTDEILDAQGVPVKEALDAYVRHIDRGHVFTAFNAQHDGRQMRAELRRAGMDDRFETTLQCCLMRSCTGLGIVKANGKGGWPSLADVCAHFGIANNTPHTAEGDAFVAAEIFLKLHALGKLQVPAVHYAKNPPAKGGQPSMDF